MNVVCPNCNREVEVEEAGLFTCPHCSQVMDVTPPKPPPVPKLIPEPPKNPKVKIPEGSGICGDCGEMSVAKVQTPGHILIEIVLWCFFLIPGIIYTIWRLTSRRVACVHCGGKMFTLTSPKGRAMLKQYHKL